MALLGIDDALRVIRRLIEKSRAAGQPIEHTLVVVGGTALAAHGVRALSHDVDLYVKGFSEDVVFETENELRKRYGDTFRLDVTSTENLWGFILVRDIEENSPVFKTLQVGAEAFEIRTLSVETLFLLKLSSDREKDRNDLPLLAGKTTPAALIERFNRLFRWHGNRQASLGYADDFIRQMQHLYSLPASEAIARMDLPRFLEGMLWETWYPDRSPDTPDD